MPPRTYFEPSDRPARQDGGGATAPNLPSSLRSNAATPTAWSTDASTLSCMIIPPTEPAVRQPEPRRHQSASSIDRRYRWCVPVSIRRRAKRSREQHLIDVKGSVAGVRDLNLLIDTGTIPSVLDARKRWRQSRSPRHPPPLFIDPHELRRDGA
jgi:hypothetical protein